MGIAAIRFGTRTHTAGMYIRLAAFLLGMVFLTFVSACDSPQPRQAETEKREAATPQPSHADRPGKIIVAMGDSLTAGLGLPESESYPTLLEGLLDDRGHSYRVVNAGISGETSSGARARVDWILKLEPEIVILETGANDGLRGIDPELVEQNINAIITRFTQEGVTVVLTGMQMVTNLGPDYVSSFNRIYPELAARHDVVLMPFFLEGVATEASLNQEDGIHPNAGGYEVIATNLLPYVMEAIARRTP